MAKKPGAPAPVEFKFIDKPVETFHRSVACVCKKGTLDFIGLTEDGSNPPKYVHECVKCKARYSFGLRYPSLAYK